MAQNFQIASFANIISVSVGSNTVTVNSNLIINGIQANGSYGANGQVLTSNGTTSYWANGGGSKGMSYGYSILFGG